MAAPRRGIVLPLILGFLALLSMLAAAVVTLSTIEFRISHNAVDAARARWAADSGIETAIARLRHAGWFDGRDWQAVETADYSVRVLDAQAQLNVNDGADLGPGHAVSRNLRRMLNVLGDQGGVAGLGDRLLERRPPGGFSHEADLLAAQGWDRAAFDRLRPWLTVDSWRDPTMAMLVPLSEAEIGCYPVRPARPLDAVGAPLYRRGHGHNRRGDYIGLRHPLRFIDPAFIETAWRTQWEAAAWTLKSLNPQWIERVARSPVNVNTASREVLTALVADLEGFFLSERRRPVPFDFGYAYLGHRTVYDPDESRSTLAWSRKGGEIGFLHRTWPIRIDPDGRRIVDEILACRERTASPNVAGLHYGAAPFGGLFRNWGQFDLFLSALVERGVLQDPRAIYIDYVYQPPTSTTTWSVSAAPSANQQRAASQAIADVLRANFDPNLHLNELNPDRPLRRLVDKTDLIVQSTELCFVPMGRFEIESTGRYQDRSVHRVSTVVKLYDAVRVGTQDEFRQGAFDQAECGPDIGEPASIWEGYVRARTRADSAGGHLEEHFDPWGPSWADPREPSGNFAARGETVGGPYGPGHRQVDLRAPADRRVDGLYVELHGAFGIALPESPFERSLTVAMWVKPSWSSAQAGKVRTMFSMSDVRWQTRARLQNLPADLLPLPLGLSFLPAYQGPPDPTPPVYGGDPRRASLMFAMGLDARFGDRAGGLGAVSPSLDRPGGPALRPGFWTHLVARLDADAEPGRRARLLLDGVEFPGSAEVAAHVDVPLGRLGDAAGTTLRIGGEFSALGARIEVPRFDFADATIDEVHVWFDAAPSGAIELARKGRFVAEAEWTSGPVPMGCPPRRLAPASTVDSPAGPADPDAAMADPPPPQIIAVSWTAHGAGAEEVWVTEEGQGMARAHGAMREPGWSRADRASVYSEVPVLEAIPWPRARIRVRFRTEGNEARFLDEFTVFYSSGSTVLSRVEGF